MKQRVSIFADLSYNVWIVCHQLHKILPFAVRNGIHAALKYREYVLFRKSMRNQHTCRDFFIIIYEVRLFRTLCMSLLPHSKERHKLGLYKHVLLVTHSFRNSIVS